MKKPTKKQIGKWCEALRSGKYKQTKGQLQSDEGYCCLGLACKVFIPKSKQVMGVFGNHLVGSYPDAQEHAPKWLVGVNVDFVDRTQDWKPIDNFQERISLASLNDVYNFTFDEMADCLEAVYIHEVME